MRPFLLCAVAVLAACGSPTKPPPDGGTIDQSCGLDCDQQKLYGLLLNNCFEYTDSTTATDPAALGVLVEDVFTLEGNVKTLRVSYTSGGQAKMTDYFAFPGRKLTLMRREYANAQSVTYKNGSNTIVGVPWTPEPTPTSGTTVDTTDTTAYLVLSSSSMMQEAVDYRVTTTDASASEATVPAGSYANALTLLFNETPDHGADGRRVLVPQTGFIGFTTPFALSGGTATQYRLQKVRTIDAGATVCGLGGP